MPKLKQPSDMDGLTPVPAPAPPRPSISLNESADPEFSSISLAPIPPVMGTATDLSRQFYRRSVSQIRMPPLPAAALIAQGSQISTHVAPVAAIADAANTTATTANTTANEASATATVAATGVIAINVSTAVGVVGGVLKQVPISTLDAITLTPNLDNLNDGALYGRVVGTALTSNKIDSTKSGFLAKGGSIPPQIVGGVASLFTYTSTTTTVTISWSSFLVYNSDGTTTSVSSGSQTVTGLSPSTTYFAYSYLDLTNAVTFASVSGSVGTPSILYATTQSPTAAQEMNLQSFTALANGAITTLTPASGSGGGSAGGGSGRCLRSTMLVCHKERGAVPLGECKEGDWILGRTDWTQIVLFELRPQSRFVRVTISNGQSTEITETHHITAITIEGESSVPASKLSLKDFLLVRGGGYSTLKKIELVEVEDALKVVLSCSPESAFFSGETAPEILCSNNVPVS